MLLLPYTSGAMTLAAPDPPVLLMLQGTGLFTADARMHTMAVGLQGPAVCPQLPAPAPQHAAPAGLPLPHPNMELRDASPQPQQGAQSKACPGSQQLKQEGDAAAAPAAPAAGQQAASGNRSDNNSSDSIQTTRAHALLHQPDTPAVSPISFPMQPRIAVKQYVQSAYVPAGKRARLAGEAEERPLARGHSWPEAGTLRTGSARCGLRRLTLLGCPTPLTDVVSSNTAASVAITPCHPPQVAAVVPVCSGFAAQRWQQ